METATQKLHRLTSYEPGRDWTEPVAEPAVLQDLQVNDFDRFPWFVKRYPAGLPRLPLPGELPPTTAPALAVLAGPAEVSPATLDLAQLSRLLYLSAGVVRTMDFSRGTYPFRRPARRAAASRWRSMSRCRRAARCPRGRAGPGGHRGAVAHRLALPGARLPARVLGRRDHDRPAAGAGRLGRPDGRAAYPFPGRGGGGPGGRGPGPRAAGGRGQPGGGCARDRTRRCARGRGRRCRAA